MSNLIIYFKQIAKSRCRLIKYFRQVRRLKTSVWFDAAFYRDNYRDVKETGINPYFHYLFFGQYESRAASKDYYQDFWETETYRYKPVNRIRVQEKSKQLSVSPKISVLLYIDKKTPSLEAKRTIQSINRQGYFNFELIVGLEADTCPAWILGNPKTRVFENKKRLSALFKAARGAYIAVLACGDRLTADALFEAAKAIEASESAPDLIYADEDEMALKGKFINPHFKTDFNYQLMLSCPYMGDFVVMKKSALAHVESPFDKRMGKAAVYDACLKLIELSENITHIQKVLCHVPEKATGEALYRLRLASSADVKKAVKNHLARTGQLAEAAEGKLAGTVNVVYKVAKTPKVSIIIPFKDNPGVLETCVNSILRHTQYDNFEIVLVSNNSREAETFALLAALRKKDKRIVTGEYNHPFNFSAINNFAAETLASGECFLFLNNDTEIISEGWLKTMVGFAMQKRTGAVTAKLLYPNRTVQSAGIGISRTGEVIEYHKFFKAEHPGYFGRLVLTQDIGAVSGACLMVEKQKFFEVGGFDEVGFPVTYNDIDLCFRLKKAGYASVLVPGIEIYHYESTTREQVLNRAESFEYQQLMQRYSEQIVKGDPYYNINFKPRGERFELA